MSSTTYRTLLRLPGAAAFFLTATAGRVGVAMTSLGIVWLVHDRTGSYATAGLVTGAFAVAEALVGPQIAKLMDRFGQPRVLPPLLAAHAVAVFLLLSVVGPSWLVTINGVLVGATIPQLGALSAARWVALIEDKSALPTAFSLESSSNGLSYLAGPALVSAVGASGFPAAGTALAGGLVVVAGLALAVQRGTAPATAGHVVRGRSRFGWGFAPVVATNLLLGGVFGAMPVAVTAFAVERGAAGAAVVLFLVSNCAGLLASWLYGLRRWPIVPRVQLALVTGWLALASLPLLVISSPVALGLAMGLTGLAIQPILTLCSLLTESAVHRTHLTQAFVWLNSASAAGSACAAAIAGHAVDSFGPPGGFAVAVAAAIAMALLAALRARH